MPLLVDTQCAIWFLEGNVRLKEHLRKLLADQNNLLFISMASFWEIAIKVGLGKLNLNSSVQTLMEKVSNSRVQILAIEKAHILPLLTLPQHHKDPFDRLIISQAMVENLEIVTTDAHFQDYPVILHQ